MRHAQPICRHQAPWKQVMEDPFEEVRTRATVEDLGKGERVALFP
jgi:hypothetical protein